MNELILAELEEESVYIFLKYFKLNIYIYIHFIYIHTHTHTHIHTHISPFCITLVNIVKKFMNNDVDLN